MTDLIKLPSTKSDIGSSSAVLSNSIDRAVSFQFEEDLCWSTRSFDRRWQRLNLKVSGGVRHYWCAWICDDRTGVGIWCYWRIFGTHEAASCCWAISLSRSELSALFASGFQVEPSLSAGDGEVWTGDLLRTKQIMSHLATALSGYIYLGISAPFWHIL